MESTDLSSNLPMQENLLTDEHLEAWLDEITTKVKLYDYYIRRQLEKTIKNYKLCVQLCEEKLEFLETYEDYKTVLATLSTTKKDRSTNPDGLTIFTYVEE